jgi:hypothetical protein
LFRVKIALLSVLLSGSVLVGLSLYSLSVMNKVGMARIDSEILTLGEGHLATRPSRDYWQNFATSLRFIYGEERSDNLIVQIKDTANEVLFKSAHWPAEITENFFPDFDRSMDATLPISDDRAGRERAADSRSAPPVGSSERVPSSRGDETRNVRRGPPPEAYKACEGKSAGAIAQFVDRRGEPL